MKRKQIITALAAVLALLLLCACSGAETDGAATAIPSQETASPSPTPTSETVELSETGEELVSLLEGISADCHPGTAGCSLVAAEYAAKLLDWNVASESDLDQAAAAAAEFLSELGEDLSGFREQLDLVYASASELVGEDGEGLLESSGYEAEGYPWNADAVEPLFGALYTGLGLELG